MDEPTKAFRQVKEILGRLDRSIDRARHERLQPEDEFRGRGEQEEKDAARSENLADRAAEPIRPKPAGDDSPPQAKPDSNGHNGANNGNGHSPSTPPASPPGGLDPSPEGRPRSAYGRAKPLRRSPSEEGGASSGPTSSDQSQHSAIQHNPGRRTA